MKKFYGIIVTILIAMYLLSGTYAFNNCTHHTIDGVDINIYNNTVYLDYVNNSPVFYVGEKKEYIITPPYINADIEIPLIKKLKFKITNNSKLVNLIISHKDINTSTNAIIFAPLPSSKKINTSTTIYWVKDPLKLNKTQVIGYYTYPKKGEIIATYSNGEPAAIKIGNKIYAGFKPDKLSLANFIYIFMIKKVFTPPITMILLILASLLSIVSIFEALKKKLANFLLHMASTSVFVILRINTNSRDKVLLNTKRKEIYDYIIDNPGCHLRKLSEELNTPLSTLSWHLRILEKAELIKSKKIGNKIIYHPVGMDKNDLLLLYLNDTQNEIYQYLLNNDAHLRKIAKDLDMNVETVRYNLRKMEELDIIGAKEDGNKIVYHINSHLE
ncbi:winged helix-turn-helix transcriptional regulator [Methanothermococcus okinawensis]|uniref:Transcriptional regulator, ArsR family n=1 Tax=Methanothermococcus okinawensis (strain DSM 14208 / JCM 11175 / IH1) TaxID=647113 RepID=F8AN38_METOI|nr:winged helix-turn-helix transcriptional regulator [Methanothermococcus okinawensis]AEH06952.1 transcriptional regulator, ArsR family [Methanothermococcus okinawensis IH1]